MLSGMLSAMILGSAFSYLDFEMKTVDEIEEENVDVYSYYNELHTIYRQNKAELTYLENENLGTFENPAEKGDEMIHLFSYSPEVYDDEQDFYALMTFRVVTVFSKEKSLEMIKNSDGFEKANEGYEWRVFELETRNENSTDPNLGVWVRQNDYTIYEDKEAAIEHKPVNLVDRRGEFELYELGRGRTFYAKQIPSDAPFYLVYQHQDSDESYVIHIEDVSIYEEEE